MPGQVISIDFSGGEERRENIECVSLILSRILGIKTVEIRLRGIWKILALVVERHLDPEPVADWFVAADRVS